MSNRSRFSLAAAALLLAACSKGGNPAAVVTTAPTVAPTGTTTTIVVRYQGNLLYNQEVDEWTNGGTATSPQKGTLIAAKNTDPSTVPTGGSVIFTGLTPGTIYCWTYSYPVPPPGPNQPTANAQVCTSNWQNGFTLGS